jgi:hypothetical protein
VGTTPHRSPVSVHASEVFGYTERSQLSPRSYGECNSEVGEDAILFLLRIMTALALML